MKKRLEAKFDGIGCLSIEHSAKCNEYTWKITWSCKGGDKVQIEVDHRLTGNEVDAYVTTHQDGGLLFGPLTSEFLHVAAKTPQVK